MFKCPWQQAASGCKPYFTMVHVFLKPMLHYRAGCKPLVNLSLGPINPVAILLWLQSREPTATASGIRHQVQGICDLASHWSPVWIPLQDATVCSINRSTSHWTDCADVAPLKPPIRHPLIHYHPTQTLRCLARHSADYINPILYVDGCGMTARHNC